MSGYAELAAISNFSFLRGASHPDEIVAQAVALGLSAIAVADWNSLAGVVRAHAQAKELGIKFIPAARLILEDGFQAVCLPTDRTAYGRLSKLLTIGNRRAEKGSCILSLPDVLAHGEGQIFLTLPPLARDEAFNESLRALRAAFPGSVYLGAARYYRAEESKRLADLEKLASLERTPLVAVGDVLYHAPQRRPLQDVLTCVREKTTVQQAGFLLEANAERHLKPPQEMIRLFEGHEHAIARTLEIATRCNFSMGELGYEYPDEICAPYATPMEAVETLAWEGAAERYGDNVPEKVRALVAHELKLIAELKYAPYFLTVYDIVKFARSKGILCQGRGSAANSAVCFCLGITSVNPAEIEILFERFVSAERGEPPDIDVDFEHERREEVIQYIYEKYGRERAAISATVQSYRSKGAIRDVGKALGLSQDAIAALSKTVWGWSEHGVKPEHVKELGLDPHDRTVAQALMLATELQGFPRHLSQHPGGFVITRGRLDEVVPIANGAMKDRTFVEWDKDDLDALGLLKIDVLGLGMLTCIRKAFELLEAHYGVKHTLASIPQDDRVYDMICAADTHGVFQIESRAQMSMLPRLRPRNFYDLVIEVAIVRPGPIQGDMVHPYLRRRQGIEPVEYPSDALRGVLQKTLGIPLFQEQAMKIAIVGAGFTPGEADQLRRAMATFRRAGTIATLRERFLKGMATNGYASEFAERCWAQIEGFGEYGFPESHAASFALLVYVSSWLKCHYPDVFTCAIINSQPMGFYSSAQLARDLYAPYVEKLEGWGYEARPVDINHSDWHCTLEPIEGEPFHALRLGLRLGKGLSQDDIEAMIKVRGNSYECIRDLYKRTKLSVATLKTLADMDAFGSLGLSRREALWEISALEGADGQRAAIEDLPLFANAIPGTLQEESPVALPRMSLGEHVLRDIATTSGISLKSYVMKLLRPLYARQGFKSARDLKNVPNGRRVKVAGIVTIRQRPGTASGVVFSTIEDETGAIQLIIWPKIFEKYRRIAMRCRLMAVEGKLQSDQGVIHVVAERLLDRSADLALVSRTDSEIEPPLARADEGNRSTDDPRGAPLRHVVEVAQRTEEILPKGRNFR